MGDNLEGLISKLIEQTKEGLIKQGTELERLRKQVAIHDIEFAGLKPEVSRFSEIQKGCSQLVQKKLDEQQRQLYDTKQKLQSAISEIRATVKTGMWFIGLSIGLLGLAVAYMALPK